MMSFSCQNHKKGESTLKWDIQYLEGSPHLRGLYVVDNNVAWVSGTNGVYALTTDGGGNWKQGVVPMAEGLDFRDVHAFDSLRAVLMSVGSPGYIYLTEDGGENWKEVHKDSRPEVFFDGLDFWNDKEGMLYGDPIDGKMLILKTADGGGSWQEIPDDSKPFTLKGEAGFAASGTGIVLKGDSLAWIGMGSNLARVFKSVDQGNTWEAVNTPMKQSNSVDGIYGMHFLDEVNGFCVGGNYKDSTSRADCIIVTKDGGNTWTHVSKPTSGFKSAMVMSNVRNEAFAVSRYGTDFSLDNGNTWNKMDTVSLYAVGSDSSGNLVLATGPYGKIAILK